MKKTREVQARLERRAERVLAELHPDLRTRTLAVCFALGGRVTPWEGYRDEARQKKARELGHSNAAWGASPHNYRPSLAVDLVLDPDRVTVRAHADDAEMPDLWDDESPEAVETWLALDDACQVHGLERVTIRDRHGRRVRDLPHIQLPDWRAYVTGSRR